MNQELFDQVKKAWPDSSIFYDGSNYVSLNICNCRISFISGQPRTPTIQTSATSTSSPPVAPSEEVEIVYEPDQAELPQTCKLEELLETINVIYDSLVKQKSCIRTPDDQTYEGFEDDAEETEFIGMPDVERNKDREITIMSWGKRHHRSTPMASQFNVNAGLLSGKKEGLDLKNLDGRSIEIQSRIVRARMFNDIVIKTIEKIERENLRVISVNCTAGRHRSVAFAEILKKHYYPKATIMHLDL